MNRIVTIFLLCCALPAAGLAQSGPAAKPALEEARPGFVSWSTQLASEVRQPPHPVRRAPLDYRGLVFLLADGRETADDELFKLGFEDSLVLTIDPADSQKISAYFLADSVIAGVAGVFTDSTQKDFSLTGDNLYWRGIATGGGKTYLWYEVLFTLHAAPAATPGLHQLTLLFVPFSSALQPVKGLALERTCLITVSPATGVASRLTEGPPRELHLSQNYPNPFNPSTTIRFALPAAAIVRLAVYDAMGAEVANLVDGGLAAGVYEINWNAAGLPSGNYWYRIQVGKAAMTRQLTLVK